MSWSNQTKDSTVFTNRGLNSLFTWDSAVVAWDDSSVSWDGRVVYANQSKDTSAFSNETKH